MSIIDCQALAGLNETVDTVRKMRKLRQNMEQRITLTGTDKLNILKAAGKYVLIEKAHKPKNVPEIILSNYVDNKNLVLDTRAIVEYETETLGGSDL